MGNWKLGVESGVEILYGRSKVHLQLGNWFFFSSSFFFFFFPSFFLSFLIKPWFRLVFKRRKDLVKVAFFLPNFAMPDTPAGYGDGSAVQSTLISSGGLCGMPS